MSSEKAGKYACYEFERKFLVPQIPSSLLTSIDRVKIEDKYFTNTRLRLRTVLGADGSFKMKLTQKFVSESGDLSKTTITNLYLNNAEAEILRTLPGFILKKTRYKFSQENFLFSIDVFDNVKNLIIAEIEFKNEFTMSQFEMPFPNWKEVTFDVSYSGYELARKLSSV